MPTNFDLKNRVLLSAAPSFPVNQTDGSYTVTPNPGSVAHVARVNGSLSGKSFDESNINVVFQSAGSLAQVQITGSFRPLVSAHACCLGCRYDCAQ